MATFLERKMAAFEAAQRRKKRARLLAVAAIALFTAAAVTGEAWLAGLGLVALVAAAVMSLRSKVGISARSESASREERRAEVAAEPLGHALPEPAGPARKEAVELLLDLGHTVTLDTRSGDDLTLEPGARQTTLRLSHPPERPKADDAVDYPRCEFGVRAEGGVWWRTVSFVDPDALTRPLETADRKIFFWEDAPGPWKSAFQKHCLIAGVRQLLDSRDRIELPVGHRSVTMMFKYQGPSIDVGWLAEERRLVVRASGMYYEVWEDGEFQDIVDQVTFAYLLDPHELLPLTAPEAHWRDWGAWEHDEGERRPEPIFERTPTV